MEASNIEIIGKGKWLYNCYNIYHDKSADHIHKLNADLIKLNDINHSMALASNNIIIGLGKIGSGKD